MTAIYTPVVKKRIQDIRITPDLDTMYQDGVLSVKLDMKGKGVVDLELVDATEKTNSYCNS